MTRDDGSEVTPCLIGKLIVATPTLLDPNFYRTVVFIGKHDAEGALGLVLNRPTSEPVSSYLPNWKGNVSFPEVIFVGGPVAKDIAVGLVRDPAAPPDDWIPIFENAGFIDLGLTPESLVTVNAARVYSGYSGWISGQLEVELSTGSWIVADAEISDLFTDDPGVLWNKVLRRQKGPASLYSSFPDDLTVN